jgi:ubiquinone/menaquinone biosynthesis C-methylase UbiE
MEKPDHQDPFTNRAKPNRVLAAALRIFFKLLYHQLAWAYDGVAWVVSLGAWQRWIRSVIPYVKGLKVLEIGFGPGHLLAELTQAGSVAFGLDESLQMTRLAQRNLSSISLSAHLVRGKAETIPLADESIQQVVLTFPAEYMLNPLTLREIHRVLIDGGSVHIIPFAWITGRSPVHRLAAWVNRITGEAPPWNESILEPLEKAGFKASWEMKDFRSSKAMLIHLAKQ